MEINQLSVSNVKKVEKNKIKVTKTMQETYRLDELQEEKDRLNRTVAYLEDEIKKTKIRLFEIEEILQNAE